MQTDPIGYQDDMNLYAYVGNNPINRTDPTDPTGMVADVQSNAQKYNPAARVADNVLKDGRLTLGEANNVWRNNNNPGFQVTVDASQLTVYQTGEFNANGNASGRIPYSHAADWAVHGSLTLHRDSGGSVSILPGSYDFQPHGSFWSSPIRNAETFGGFFVGSEAGTSVGTDYLINYSGSPNVER